ncbi:MAG TPA: hypothetical protein VK891_14660 [Euzebyales bacterium]|nr:hypothetical protein [Euzebyales bacterium]
MDDNHERDVLAPRTALAWAAGAEDTPGRWLYDEADIAAARTRGEAVHATEVDRRGGRTWLRQVRGHAPLADVIRLTTDIEDLRVTLIDLAERAAQALSTTRD